MAMQRAQFLSLMAEGLRKVFFDHFDELPSVYPQIFDIQKSTKRMETDQTIAGIGMLSVKPEGEPTTYEDMTEGFSQSAMHTAYSKGIRVSRELIDDDQYNIINKRTRALARSAKYRKEWDHAKMFNNAEATTYFTCGDGLALLSNSHKLAASTTTFDNYAASTSLSVTALEAAFNAMRRFPDDNNMLIALEPNTLLIAPELEWDAEEILGSTNKPYTADNEKNTMRGRLKIVKWPFLTGTATWFVLADKGVIAPTSFNRTPVEFSRDGDFDTEDLKVKVYTRYSLMCLDPRFCYGDVG